MEKTMNTEQLFNKKIREYKSEIFIDDFSADFDHCVNLDNAATTPLLKIVEKNKNFSCKLRLCA